MLHRYFQKNIIASIIVVLTVLTGWTTAQGETVSDATVADKGIDTPAPKTAPAKGIVAPTLETAPAKSVVAPTLEAGKPAFVSYIAEIIANNVYIRSGPAMPYHAVGKFVRGQHVVVRKELLGKRNWAMIEPTAQCFSYISKKYVLLPDISVDTRPKLTEKTELGTSAAAEVEKTAEKMVSQIITGTVTADAVRVRAGSILVPPDNATVQTVLKKSTKVQIIGQRDDYYKIVPPANCYFWVSFDFIKKAGPAEPDKLAKLRDIASRDAAGLIEKNDGDLKLQLPEYKKLAEQFLAQQAKPLKDRDFTDLKQQVEKFIGSAKTDYIKTTAQNLSHNIEQTDKTLQIYKQSLANDEQLHVKLAKIDEKIQKTITIDNPSGKRETDIVIKGRLAKSSVFTAGNKNQRFIVFDENDKIIYYAISGKDDIKLADWIDKTVSLMGKVKYDQFGGTRLLYVRNITEVTKE